MWTLDKKAKNKIEALEMWIYRRMGKIVWSEKKTNNEFLKFNTVRKRQITFFDHIKKQITFFDHIKRHNSILKDILQGKIQGKITEADKD
jgi:hypothetical protein